MEFGKVENLHGLDLSLPPDHPATARVLAAQQGGPVQVYVGAPVWACKEWVGKVYPPATKEKDFLRHYAQRFNCIELNTTHYRTPDAATVRRWYAEAAPNFKFCPKLLQEITHQHQLQGEALLRTQLFCASIAPLADKLGICFMQLPPYFGPSQSGVLEKYLRQFPREIPLAVEFRHPAWFEGRVGARPFDAMAGVMEELDIATVITDVAGRRDVLHQRLCNGTLVLRFVGNNLHPSDFARVSDWVQRLHQWIGQGLQKAYLWMHEPDNVLAPELANDLITKLNPACGLNIAAPLLPARPSQLGLF